MHTLALRLLRDAWDLAETAEERDSYAESIAALETVPVHSLDSL